MYKKKILPKISHYIPDIFWFGIWNEKIEFSFSSYFSYQQNVEDTNNHESFGQISNFNFEQIDHFR
jgi:hypothetical protein